MKVHIIGSEKTRDPFPDWWYKSLLNPRKRKKQRLPRKLKKRLVKGYCFEKYGCERVPKSILRDVKCAVKSYRIRRRRRASAIYLQSQLIKALDSM